MSASLALQTAMMAALQADAALAALVGSEIHDGAPQGTRFPHVTLAETSALDWDTLSEDGEEHFVAFHIYSRTGGRREALEIAAAMVAVLHEADLALDGHSLVNLRVEAVDARREADGRTWRGRVRLRGVTEVGE